MKAYFFPNRNQLLRERFSKFLERISQNLQIMDLLMAFDFKRRYRAPIRFFVVYCPPWLLLSTAFFSSVLFPNSVQICTQVFLQFQENSLEGLPMLDSNKECLAFYSL